MTGSAVLYALLSGTRATADCLSEEKREGTLGLLFLTDLKGYDIVFGKLAATSLNVFYGILAVVPILAVPLLMGGVAPAEFGRMALVALDTLFFSLAIGIGVSAMSRSGRKAAGVTLFILLVFTMALPIGGETLVELGKLPRPLGILFLLPSPGFTFAMAFDPVYKSTAGLGLMGSSGARGYWWSLAIIHGLGWLFLTLACVLAPRSWQDKPAGAQTLRWRERWLQWTFGGQAERAAFRRQLLDQNAFFWLAARVRLKPAFVWGVLGLVACGWGWGLAKYHHDWLNAPMYVMTAIVLNLVIKIWFASEAGRQLAEDRKNGALELLLSTPLSVREILRGQMLALRRQFLGPVVVVLLVCGLFMGASLSESMSTEDRNTAICFWLAGMAMLIPDLIGLYWVGLWQGLTAKNPNRVAGASATCILALPWVILATICMVVSVTWMVVRQQTDFGPISVIGLWFGLGLATDIGFSAWSRHKLLTEFRLAAEQRYSKRAGFWKRFFGGAVIPA
jgi:ABC-type Na+ efflux pump permease subunit